MAVNLIRNSKVYFTTSLAGDAVDFANCSATNTFELQVLDGFSFTQNTTTESVTLNEAGAVPNRGQRTYNTSLEPVDFSFSTYIRPRFVEAGASDRITAEESVLWNALMGVGAIGSGGAWVETASAAPTTVASFSIANSNVHQLQKFALIINMDSVQYTIQNCALDNATIDFGIDAIATIAWAGKGTAITTSETITPFTFAPKNTTAKYIANKLSVMTLFEGINQSAGTAYDIAITGGSLTIANNLTYLTPANLGVVNTPITYFTGNRTVSGNITAYLRNGTGTNHTAELMQAILAGASSAQDTKYTMTLKMGGTGTPRVELFMPATMISVPTINTEQVVSTSIAFSAQSYTGADYNIEEANELTVKYFAA